MAARAAGGGLLVGAAVWEAGARARAVSAEDAAALAGPAAGGAGGGGAAARGPRGGPAGASVRAGDWLLLDRVGPGALRRYRRGDLVEVAAPGGALAPGRPRLRRLVGLEGDWVSRPGGEGPAGWFGDDVVEVPRGCCWVEADAPGGAGAAGEVVPLALVTARAARVVWPPGRAGAVPAGAPGLAARVVREHAKPRSPWDGPSSWGRFFREWRGGGPRG